MYPDTRSLTNSVMQAVSKKRSDSMHTPQDILESEFVGEARSQLSTLTGEIALRNAVINKNDAYIYGDLLIRSIDIPIGHDKTPVNWPRRAVEIHRTEFMGKGFTVASTYDSQDVSDAQDDNDKQRILIENKKRKDFAEKRRQTIDAIIRDNGGAAMFADMAEGASAVGDAVVKAWYDKDKKKYILSPVEAVEHCYAIWSKDDFRSFDCFAYIYQISKQQAQRQYNVGENVATSPLGTPLAVLSSANTMQYISTQPMVTIMEIAGNIQGWGTNGNGVIERVEVGKENPINAVIVGNEIKKLVDDEKFIPKYYILPNKRIRRRPWGKPDISDEAISITQTYIETLSDWRTVGSRVNFPKFKGYGFGLGAQIPGFKPRKSEIIPLTEGQDIQPVTMGQSAQLGEVDFPRQMSEEKEQFLIEVAIPPSLFNQQDNQSDSNRVEITAMKSLADIVANKQQLWSPVLTQMFDDALQTLAKFDPQYKDLVEEDGNWYLRVLWPSMMNKDDPVYQTMLLNSFNATTMSIQTYLEMKGETKEELDRIRDELEDPLLSAIHGKIIGQLASMKNAPNPSMLPPKVSVNLRGDLSPGQEANLSAMHGFNNGPIVGPTVGPQGNTGLKADDDFVNQGMIQGQKNVTLPIQKDANGFPLPMTGNPAAPQGQQNPSSPGVSNPTGNNQIATPANNVPGSQPMSQPGSGAPATSPQGNLNKAQQHKGA